MKRLIVGLTIATVSAVAAAGEANGVWKTQANDGGGYLEVTIAPCGSDAGKTCGTISNAFTTQGVDPKYANLGKAMIKDMTTSDGTRYSGGTIWDPESGKTYNSKMTLEGDLLDVDGCVSIFCTGQHWTRVK